MQATRRRILTYLEANHLVTAPELSRAFGMTSANIRHHLSHLNLAGLVEVVGQQASEGPGRPTLVYALTINALGGEVNRLAGALLEEQLAGKTTAQVTLQLRQIARRLVGPEPDQGGNLTQRLYQTIRRLRSLEYDARWEAHAAGPRIVLDRCPFAALKDLYPEICHLDGQILSLLLGETVEQLATRSRSPEGPRHCVFLIKVLGQ
jgi:predicted ArsR family transcriptional regulator